MYQIQFSDFSALPESRLQSLNTAGYVDAFLAAALMRVMRAAVPIPAVAAASVLHSAVVSGSVVGVLGPSRHLGSLTAANWVSFDFNVSYSSC